MIIWLITAAILLILEVATQAIWALCFAIGCIAAMIVSAGTDAWAVQAMAMSGVAIISWLLLSPLLKNYGSGNNGRASRTGMEALLGRRATVTEDIKEGGLGRARIDGDVWQVRAPEASRTVHTGEKVVVTDFDSIILTVNTL